MNKCHFDVDAGCLMDSPGLEKPESWASVYARIACLSNHKFEDLNLGKLFHLEDIFTLLNGFSYVYLMSSYALKQPNSSTTQSTISVLGPGWVECGPIEAGFVWLGRVEGQLSSGWVKNFRCKFNPNPPYTNLTQLKILGGWVQVGLNS